MIGPDPLGCEFERGRFGRGHLGAFCIDLVCGERERAELEPVKPGGQLSQSRITLGTDLGDDGRHGVIDIRGIFALGGQERLKARLEIVVGCAQKFHARRCRPPVRNAQRRRSRVMKMSLVRTPLTSAALGSTPQP